MVLIMNAEDPTVFKKQNLSLVKINRSYCILALLLTVFVSCVVINGRQGPYHELYDYWEHTACIKEMARDLLNPQNPFLQVGGATTPRYTPYIFLLALSKKVFFNDLSTLLSVVSIISFVILLVGLYRFCSEYFQDSQMPLYSLVTLLFLWGGDFNFSSEYSLRFLSYTLFYPSILTFGLSFWGLYYFLSFVRYDKSSDYWKYFLLSVFIFVSHPLTGSFFLLTVFLVAITEGRRPLRNLLFYGINVAIVLVCLVTWPYFSFLEALSKSVSTPWAEETRMYLYRTSNLYKMGPALLGVPAAFALLAKRKFPVISWGFLICTAIYVLTYKPKIFLGERYIFYVIFFMHMALAWYLRQVEALSPAVIKRAVVQLSERNLHVLLLSLMVFCGMVAQVAKITSEQYGYSLWFQPRPIVRPYTNPLEKYQALENRFPPGSVVLSDPLTAWVLPTLCDTKIIALYHDNPLVPDNVQRTRDSMAVYAAETSLADRRKILEQYRVTHVLLNYARMVKDDVNQMNNYYLDFRISDEAVRDLEQLGRVVFKNAIFSLYRINLPPQRPQQ